MGAPKSSSAIRSLFAKAATGTPRDDGKIATVLRLRLAGARSSEPGRPAAAEAACWRRSASFVTREASRRRYLMVVAGCLEGGRSVSGQRAGYRRGTDLVEMALKRVRGMRASSVSRMAWTVLLRSDSMMTSSSLKRDRAASQHRDRVPDGSRGARTRHSRPGRARQRCRRLSLLQTLSAREAVR